jgi:ATPase complex subunit ATP10
LKDLKDSKNKPILSNETAIPAQDAKLFPSLNDVSTLTGEKVDTPSFFTRNNRKYVLMFLVYCIYIDNVINSLISGHQLLDGRTHLYVIGTKDATAQCTLVAVSFKDFGFKLLPSWVVPFEKAFIPDSSPATIGRAEVIHLSITEGRLQSYLSGFITSGVRKNTPEEKHSRTLLYFGDKTEWRDTLRMHNTLTGYVFLLDGMGRVRWAGSGSATENELNTLTSIAKELTPLLDPSIAKQQVQKQKSHVKRRPPRPK